MGWTRWKKHETEVAHLDGLTSQQMMFQRKGADMLGHASGAVVFLAFSFRKGLEDVRKFSKQRDDFSVQWEPPDEAEKV